MELFLNVTWLVLSIGLGALLFASRSRCQSTPGSLILSRRTAWISYLLLIALLLPAISMTDDLMAMAAPTDSEQIVRRYEAGVTGQPVVTPVAAYYLPTRPDFSCVFVTAAEFIPFHRFAIPKIPQPTCIQGRAPPAIV